ncbi:MAG: TIR domain-containing protein, partial [Proteobacteria bacterium]|nr:TIR domain-containing protein [Pseudomonadota bacterium]
QLLDDVAEPGSYLPPRYRLGTMVVDERFEHMFRALGWTQFTPLTKTDEWVTPFKNGALIEQVIRKRAFTNMRLVRNDNASIAAFNKIADELTARMKGHSGTVALDYNYAWPYETTFKGLLLQKSQKSLPPLPARQLLLSVIRDTLGRRTHRRGEVHLNTDILWSRLFRHVWERLNRAGSKKGPLLALGKPANSVTTILAQAPFISPEDVPTGCSDMIVMSRTRCPTTTCLKLAWQLLTKAIEAHIPLEIIFKKKTKQPGRKQRLKLHPSIYRLVVNADAQHQLETLPQIKKDCDTPDSIPSTAWDTAADLVRNEDNPAIPDLLHDMRQVGVLPLHDCLAESTYFIMALSVLVRCPESSTIYTFPFRTIADADVSATMGVMFCGKKELESASLEYIWSVSEIVFNEDIEDVYVEAESYIDRLKPRHDNPTVAKWQNRQPIAELRTFQDDDDSPVVLIVVAADIENQALLELSGLSDQQAKDRSFPVGKQSCVDLGFQKFAVWATLCVPDPEGVLDSQATVDDLIATIATKRKVAAVIMPGIAFGLKQDEQRIGDILLSTQIRLYEPAQTIEGGHERPRPIVPEANSFLVSTFRMSTPNWQKNTPDKDLRPRVHAGLFLSGGKLVNDPHMVFKLKQNARHAIGGEMAGAGVYASAARNQTPWIIVKSICDWGMHKGDNYQLNAAKNSADFVYHVLETRSFTTLVNKSHYSSDIPDKRNKVKLKKEDGPTMTQNTADRRFRIALSFSGDERSYVKKVADHLAKHFGEKHVFYDQNYRPELARVNLDTYLQDIYHKDSDLVALFFSDSYNKKDWCGLEWRAIRDLITTRPDHIIPIKMSASVLPKGLFPVDGYLPADELDPIDIAKDIIKRYAIEFLQSASIP